MSKNFDFYRSTNSRLHAALDQEDSYTRYLKRIEYIVDRKPRVDQSSSYYMGFLNRVKQISRKHQSTQKLNNITQQNQHLFQKIMRVKNRKCQVDRNDKYSLALHQKRHREQERINDQNRKIALRVIQQHPKVQFGNEQIIGKQSPRRTTEKSFFDSRVKQRKLPKLLYVRG